MMCCYNSSSRCDVEYRADLAILVGKLEMRARKDSVVSVPLEAVLG